MRSIRIEHLLQREPNLTNVAAVRSEIEGAVFHAGAHNNGLFMEYVVLKALRKNVHRH